MNRPNRIDRTRLFHMRRQLYSIGEVTPEFLAYTKHFSLDHSIIQAHAGLLAVVLARFWR